MEYVEGQAITDALAGRPLEVILETFFKVCDAVTFAHENGILHRDLKPSNILVTPEGTPRIIDFGVSKATNPEAIPGITLYTVDEVAVGTPEYMAPERGEDVDERSDVYALGATLYELVTGTMPPKPDEALRKASSSSLLEVPDDLDAILNRAMARKAEQRYPSVRDFADDLRRCQSGIPIDRASRQINPWLPAGLVAAVLLALIAFWVSQNEQPSTERGQAFQGVRHEAFGHPRDIFVNRDGTRAVATFIENGPVILFNPNDGEVIFTYPSYTQGISSSSFDEEGDRFVIAFSDGTFRWFASDDGRILSPYLDCTPRESVWVPNILVTVIAGAESPTVLTVTPDSAIRAWAEDGSAQWEMPLVSPPYDLEISPGKRTAIVGSRSGRINLIDLVQVKKRTLTGLGGANYRMNFSPNGSLFASAGFDHQASLWSTEGELLHRLKHDGKCGDVQFSPDGSLLASASWDGTARLWNVETGEEVHQFVHKADILTARFSPDGKILATGGRNNLVRFWDVETKEEAAPPYFCEGAVGEITFHVRSDGELNVLVSTWAAALHIIPLDR